LLFLPRVKNLSASLADTDDTGNGGNITMTKGGSVAIDPSIHSRMDLSHNCTTCDVRIGAAGLLSGLRRM